MERPDPNVFNDWLAYANAMDKFALSLELKLDRITKRLEEMKSMQRKICAWRQVQAKTRNKTFCEWLKNF